MSDDRSWLIAPINSRTTKADLVAIVRAMPPKYRGDSDTGYSMPARKLELRHWIEDQRAKYWNDQQRRSHQHSADHRRKRDAPRSLCQISADECNAWLRSLPSQTDWNEVPG